MTIKSNRGAVSALTTLASVSFAFTAAHAETAQIVADSETSPVLVTWPVLLIGAVVFLGWSGLRRTSD